MRIYNGTNSFLCLPYVGNQRVNVDGHSVSGDLGANIEFITNIIVSYRDTEVAFIVSGPYELNLFSNIPGASLYVVQTLDEAIERFAPKKEAVAPVEYVSAGVYSEEKDCCEDDCDCDCECCDEGSCICDSKCNETLTKVLDGNYDPETFGRSTVSLVGESVELPEAPEEKTYTRDLTGSIGSKLENTKSSYYSKKKRR